MVPDPDIVSRVFTHRGTTYNCRWNRTNHARLGKEMGDLASLWGHLSSVLTGRVPENPFMGLPYRRASSLHLDLSSKTSKIRLRNRLMSSGMITSRVDDDLVRLTREFHRLRREDSYCADHSILEEFLMRDPNTIATEVPVWSDRHMLSGHIDLVRAVDGIIQVCDYKPGPLHETGQRFLNSLPQVAAYGEMMAYHLSDTLRSADSGGLLPRVICTVFDSHSSWYFGAELFVTLCSMGVIRDFSLS
ncbi:MAG: hypothetical protein QXS20_06570 [Candidatus Thorarchaeota archaeon]